MTLERLNRLNAEAFVAAVGWVFEDSPWVAERVESKRPFRDIEALHEAMVREVENAAPAEQVALLRAHPDLGSRAHLSDASNTEQAGAGLDTLSPEELDLFTTRNEIYKTKFGFPFL